MGRGDVAAVVELWYEDDELKVENACRDWAFRSVGLALKFDCALLTRKVHRRAHVLARPPPDPGGQGKLRTINIQHAPNTSLK